MSNALRDDGHRPGSHPALLTAARHATTAGRAGRGAAGGLARSGGRLAVVVGRGLAAVPLVTWAIALGAIAGVVLVVELTGAIAGALHSGHPVLLSPPAALAVFWHWATDEGGIRRTAWPTDVVGDLGRLQQIGAVLAIAVLLVLGLLVCCWSLYRSMRVERLRDVYRERGARWAEGRELRRLFVRRPTPGRLTLGTHAGHLIAAQDNASTLIVAPSQSYKTSGLAVPAMVEWEGPCLASSVKGDLIKDTIVARSRIGEVKVFDPTDSTQYLGSVWSPVAAATSWSAARRVASSILQIGTRQHGGQDDSFWRQAGAAYLAPLLLAGNRLGVGTSDVLTWATSTEQDSVEPAIAALKILVDQGVAGADVALHDVRQMWGTEPRYRSSVIGTLNTHLDAWKEPELAEATNHRDERDAGITPEWLLNGNNTLFLSAPAAEQRRLRGLFVALITEVVAAAFARAARTGRPLDPRLLLMLDEAANIAPLPNIDEIASTGPGQGVLLCTILQNLSQAQEVWGADRADTILANHRARLFGSGIGDTATLDYISRSLGDEARENATISKKRASIIDLGSRSENLEHRNLLGHHEIRQLKEGHALLLYGQLPPTQIKLRPWFRDRRLTALVDPQAELPHLAPIKPVQERPALIVLPTEQEVTAPAVVQPQPAALQRELAGQLTLDMAAADCTPETSAPLKKPAAPLGEAPARGDVRGRLERRLGADASPAVAALRLAADAGTHAILTSAHALLLQDADAFSTDVDWGTAEILATDDARDALTDALLRTGAALEQTDEHGDEHWAARDGDARLLVHYTTVPVLLEAMDGAETLAIDGVGELHVLEADHITL